MKSIRLALLFAILFLCACSTSGREKAPEAEAETIALAEDERIVRFHIFVDSQSYKRRIQPIRTMIEGRDHLYRVEVLDGAVERYPEKAEDGAAHGIPHVRCLVLVKDDFGADTGLVGEEITLSAYAHPQIQVYRMPRLIEDREYVILSEGEDAIRGGTASSMFFRVSEIDGCEYVYPYFVDCGALACAEPVDDPEEASIYKQDTDWDVLSYIEKCGLDTPLFYERMKLDAFVTEVAQLQKEVSGAK